jgi:LEA14-like dessication related protein
MKLVLVLTAALYLSSCAYLNQNFLKDPEVNVVDFKVTHVTLEDISVAVKMNIKNPNAIPLKLDEVSYTLKFSGNEVTEGHFKDGVNIPASGQSDVTVPLQFKYSSVSSVISSLFKNTFTKEYEIAGTAKFGVFSIPFNKKGEVKFTK